MGRCIGLVGAVTAGRERRKLSHTYQITEDADLEATKLIPLGQSYKSRNTRDTKGHEGDRKRGFAEEMLLSEQRFELFVNLLEWEKKKLREWENPSGGESMTLVRQLLSTIPKTKLQVITYLLYLLDVKGNYFFILVFK